MASVVGLVSIHIFGFDDPQAKKYAESCGIAFQLTNILRDLKEDAGMGRVYLPEEDLRAHNYTAEDLANEVYDERFIALMKFEVDRAKGYYEAARPLLGMVHASGRDGLACDGGYLLRAAGEDRTLELQRLRWPGFAFALAKAFDCRQGACVFRLAGDRN